MGSIANPQQKVIMKLCSDYLLTVVSYTTWFIAQVVLEICYEDILVFCVFV